MESPPNILFVLCDQLGARWLPLHGHPIVSTPHLDRFAKESTVFQRAITTSPVCTPYRGCLLSGRYPSQTGLLENGRAYPWGLKSIADRLNEGGYASHYVGKWHLSGSPQQNRWVPPEKRAGFQNFIGWESHHVDHFGGLIWEDEPEHPIEMPGHETDALTDIALAQLSKAAQAPEPFLLMLSYQAPHPPCSPPERYRAPYERRELLREPNAEASAWFKVDSWNADYDIETFRQLYFGEISQLDAAFGRLLTALDETGLRENTLVIFTSDHGEMAGARGLFGKGVMYEEALHVPLIIRAPGQATGRRTDFTASTIDMLPTLLDYAGCAPEERAEGISLRPYVEGKTSVEDRVAISEYRNFCATTRDWKLFTRGRSLENAALYNLAEDPYEMNNLLDDPSCADQQSYLSRELARWHQRVVGNEESSHPAIPESETRWSQANI